MTGSRSTSDRAARRRRLRYAGLGAALLFVAGVELRRARRRKRDKELDALLDKRACERGRDGR